MFRAILRMMPELLGASSPDPARLAARLLRKALDLYRGDS